MKYKIEAEHVKNEKKINHVCETRNISKLIRVLGCYGYIVFTHYEVDRNVGDPIKIINIRR
jgi:hypothetical protein